MIFETKNWPTRLAIIYILCLSSAAYSDSSEAEIDTLTDIDMPAFQFLRQNESWDVVREIPVSSRSDIVRNLKYIPLNEDGSNWASFGGHLRARYESWDNFGFGAPATDSDDFGLGRMFFHGDFHFGTSARVFVEAKTAFSTDRNLPGGNRTIDVDEYDIQQAFVDLSFSINDDTRFTLRVGRQALLFGNQRLISPLPWGNTLRSWDGLTGILNFKTWMVAGFWTQFAPVEKFDFNQADSATEFFGTYATGPSPIVEGSNMDVYFLGLSRDKATFGGRQGQEDRYTLGSRIFGSFSNSAFDYDVELAYQFGEFGRSDIEAFMMAMQFGYSLPETRGNPRLHLGLDYASGDDGGSDLGTFNQLFPLGHAYLGLMDTIGRQNIIDLNPGVSIAANSKTTLRLDAHFFWLANDRDALYNAGGGVVRQAMVGGSSRIGDELDMTMQYTFNSNTILTVGYSHFFAGDSISDSGASKNTGFGYVQTQFTF